MFQSKQYTLEWSNPHYYTRRVKEAIHVILHPNNINRDSGIEIQKAQQQENRSTVDRRGSRSLSETVGVESRQSEVETQQQLPILVVDRRTRSMKTAIVFAQGY